MQFKSWNWFEIAPACTAIHSQAAADQMINCATPVIFHVNDGNINHEYEHREFIFLFLENDLRFLLIGFIVFQEY